MDDCRWRNLFRFAKAAVCGLMLAAVSAHAEEIERGAPEELTAEGAVLMDAFSGTILYAKNPDERLYPASTTKILTALLVIESGDLDREVVVEQSDTEVEPSALYIKPGDRIKRIDMLYGLMLKSANDVALALARDNAGSVEAFAERMTQRARELGATASNFKNPHGLHHKDHYTTARDLAIISRAAMSQPLFRQIVATRNHPWPAGDVKEVHNKNRLLRDFPGCTGLKTGYTRAAGQCLVSSALQDGREVISVVLKAKKPGLWSDSKKLLTFGLATTFERQLNSSSMSSHRVN
jgi:D-alanyl-D-alanine carboxypeptidase (penicillin-binding protein 5/6)